MKAWRVWLQDGCALLVDAETASEAEREARELIDDAWDPGSPHESYQITLTECLSLETKV